MPCRPSRLPLVALVALALLGAAPGCRSAIESADLPLRPHFETEVTVGTGRLRMAWDTGTQCTLLGSAAAQRLQLPPAQPDQALQVVDASGVAREVRESVRVAGLRLGATGISTFVAPTLPLGPHFGAEGVLGMDLLLVAAWIVEPAEGRLRMVAADRLDAELAAAGYAVRSRLPLRVEHGRAFVRARLEDRLDVELLLDTGSRGTCLPEAVVEALALPPGEALVAPEQRRELEELRAAFERLGVQATGLEVEAGGAVGLHGVEVASRPFHLRRLALGDLQLADLCVWSRPGDGARLGEDVLGRVPWAVHWQRGELLLLARRAE